MQRLGQADLAGKAELDDTAAAFAAGTGAGALQDSELNSCGWDTEQAEEREDSSTEGIDRDVARFGGGCDDAGAGKPHIHVRL